MLIEQAIVLTLNADTILSQKRNNRLYFQMIPQVEKPDTAASLLPAQVYRRIDDETIRTLDGPSNLRIAQIQITSLSTVPLEAMEIADRTRSLLDGWNGPMGDLKRVNITYDGESDGIDESAGLDQLRVFTRSQDFSVWFSQ